MRELAEACYIEIGRQGRRNIYSVVRGLPLRHPIEMHRTVDDLFALVEDKS